MKLIKLTGLHTGKPIWVNTERIEIIEPNEKWINTLASQSNRYV